MQRKKVHLKQADELRDLVDFNCPLNIIEDIMECLPIYKASMIAELLESKAPRLTQNISSSKGRGLVLLRLCNELIRRLSKTQHAGICGRLLLLLSKSFPSAERSGVNLRGDLNIDNVTTIEPATDGMTTYNLNNIIANLTSGQDVQVEDAFYTAFWKLQFFMLHPVQSLMSENWPFVTKILDDVVSVFEKCKALGQAAATSEAQDIDNKFFFPKFITSHKLLRLQVQSFGATCLDSCRISAFARHC